MADRGESILDCFVSHLKSKICNLKFLLSPEGKALGQESGQPGLDDFLLRRLEIVFYAALLDHVLFNVINAVGGMPIAIARLANTAGVDEILSGGVDLKLLDAHATHAAFFPNKSHRHVGMAEKTNSRVLIGKAGGGVEIVEDVS